MIRVLNFDDREFTTLKPVVDPLGRVIEEVLSGVGIVRRGSCAVSASADAGHGAFDDDEVLVGAL